jgi:hypothetical protein
MKSSNKINRIKDHNTKGIEIMITEITTEEVVTDEEEEGNREIQEKDLITMTATIKGHLR